MFKDKLLDRPWTVILITVILYFSIGLLTSDDRAGVDKLYYILFFISTLWTFGSIYSDIKTRIANRIFLKDFPKLILNIMPFLISLGLSIYHYNGISIILVWLLLPTIIIVTDLISGLKKVLKTKLK